MSRTRKSRRAAPKVAGYVVVYVRHGCVGHEAGSHNYPRDVGILFAGGILGTVYPTYNAARAAARRAITYWNQPRYPRVRRARDTMRNTFRIQRLVAPMPTPAPSGSRRSAPSRPSHTRKGRTS